MARELYENTYKTDRHFRFGENWQNFLRSLTPAQIDSATASLATFLGAKTLKGRRFLDLGCGSGLSSLAAYRLGADEVVSIDVDEGAVVSTRSLMDAAHRPARWVIKKGSALNRRFLRRLGRFDVVYSWGVLHHTGDMYRAIENAGDLVRPGGILYISIYNENKTNFVHGTSAFWLRVKKKYNHSGPITKSVLYYLYASYLLLGLLITRKNPARYVRNYRTFRGMSWRHDVLDWLGGYPYEFAPPDNIINFLGERGFACKKLTYHNTIGCNEYLFIKQKS